MKTRGGRLDQLIEAALASLLALRAHHPVGGRAAMMAQLGHTDPAFTLRVYAHAMRRGEGDKEALKALVEGRHRAPAGR